MTRQDFHRPSGPPEAFFRTDGQGEGPVVVVHHVRKTAGSSLRQFVRANLSSTEVEILPREIGKRGDPGPLREWYGSWYRALPEERRDRLCCVMAHTAGYLLPALDRPVDALTLVREPLDRVISFHYFMRRGDQVKRTLAEMYTAGGSPGDTRSSRWEYFNGQSRHLLSVFYNMSELPFSAGPCANADLWRARLRDLVERVFLVGVQDRFEEYVGELARRYGWRATVPHSKVNAARPAVSEISAVLRDTILAHNWLDTELYAICRQAQDRAGRGAQGL